MRLLFMTAETCPTFRADVAGLFGKYLPNYGVFSDVVTIKTPAHIGPVTWGGGKALLCGSPSGVAWRHIRKFLHCAKHLLFASKTNYQAIQVRDMPFLAAFCLVIARIKGLPFIYWMSYPIPEGQIIRAKARGLNAGPGKSLLLWLRGQLGKFLLYSLVLPRAKHVFVQSEKMKSEVVAHGLLATRVTPVPMGVDCAELYAANIAPCDDSRLDARQVIVYLGTLDAPRHIEVLFEMLASIRETHPQALLVLVGDTKDGNHRAWLNTQARKAGVENHVIWTGWLPMSEAWRYVLAGRVGVSPFPRGHLLDVASPTKVPEYLAIGIPVVCNDNPDQQEVIEASGGGLCVNYTADEFAGAVIKLLDEPEDLRATRVQAGQRYIAKNRDYNVIAEQVAATFVTLLNT